MHTQNERLFPNEKMLRGHPRLQPANVVRRSPELSWAEYTDGLYRLKWGAIGPKTTQSASAHEQTAGNIQSIQSVVDSHKKIAVKKRTRTSTCPPPMLPLCPCQAAHSVQHIRASSSLDLGPCSRNLSPLRGLVAFFIYTPGQLATAAPSALVLMPL